MIRCPACNSSQILVKDSRKKKEGIRRTRYCKQCKTRFYTLETYLIDPKTDKPRISNRKERAK